MAIPRRLRSEHSPPVVFCLSGHDPSGGAGVQADIEAVAAMGCHAVSVITCLTEQDTRNVRRIFPQKADDFLSQARTVLADVRVAAFKIGLVGNADLAHAIAALLAEHPQVPVVLDPVLAAGGGTELADAQLLEAFRQRLLPRVSVLTPNSIEARRLARRDDLEVCAAWLMAKGCRHVLITGTHEQRPEVVNTLYSPGEKETLRWQRLPHEYHGSGCTLAAALAACLARGMPVAAAAREAQRFAWHALEAGFRPGQGQYVPRRIRGDKNP